MNTTSLRKFVSLILLGATCIASCCMIAQAQNNDDMTSINAKSAKRIDTVIDNISCVPLNPRVDDIVTLTCRLMYKQPTGTRPNEFIWKPLPHKQVQIKFDFSPPQPPQDQFATTTTGGYASFKFIFRNAKYRIVDGKFHFQQDNMYAGCQHPFHFDLK